VLKEEDTYGEL